MTRSLRRFQATVAPLVPTRRNNVGHWVDVPRFEQYNFVVDQAANRNAVLANTATQPGVPRTGVVYSTSATYNGVTYTAGNAPSYPAAERLNGPGVRGVLMRYRWSELEQASGVYTFERVAGELEHCRVIGNGRGTRFGFILFLEMRTFDGINPAPPYLQPYTTTNGSTVQLWRWNSTVRARFAALVSALAAQFDTHVCWEGIATSETSTGNPPTSTGYTPELYRDALIAETNAIAAATVYGKHFFYQNFLSGHNSYLDAVVQAGVTNGAMVMGGPDILPNITNALATSTYPRYTTFKTQLPKFCSLQNDSHSWNIATGANGPPYSAMVDMYNWGLTNLYLNYVMWTWRRTGAGNHFSTNTTTVGLEDAGVIDANRTFAPVGGWAS